MKFKALLAAGALFAATAPAHAETLNMSLSDFFAKSENTDMLQGFTFKFGGSAYGTQVGPVTVKRMANGFHKPAEVACERALLNALIRLREYSISRGGTAVVAIKSGNGYFSDSSTEYVCDKSHVKAAINLSGTVIK